MLALMPPSPPSVYTHTDDFAHYRGRNLLRLHYLRLLAEQEDRRTERRAALAGSVLILSILAMAILL